MSQNDNSHITEMQSNYISNNILQIIKQNIEFVEKYVEIVDDKISEETERDIIFRELGVIAFSCSEALCKSLLVEIYKSCKRRNCCKKCNYNFFKSVDEIAKHDFVSIINHLLNMRLVGLMSEDIDNMMCLKNLRNYVHISKYLYTNNKSMIFDKKYVYSMLNVFYCLLDQYELNTWYYTNKDICIKELDCNGYETTKKQNEKSSRLYYTYKIVYLFDKMFDDKELSEDDKRYLSKISRGEVDKELLAQHLSTKIRFKSQLFKDEKKYINSIKKFLTKIDHYGKRNDLSRMIKEKLEIINSSIIS